MCRLCQGLYAYLAKQHSWTTTETAREIHWEAFQQAANNYTSTDNHLMKLVYDQLPTRHHRSRFEKWTTSTCRHCDQDETFVHLMQCDNSESRKFRRSLPQQIRKVCTDRDLPHNVVSAFVIAIEDWFRKLDPLRGLPTPDILHPVIQSQSLAFYYYYY